MTDNITRESWLNGAAQLIFLDILNPVTDIQPDVRVSMGDAKQKQPARSHPRSASTASVNEIYISAYTSDTLLVLTALTRELIHACDDHQSGLKGFYAHTARQIGLLAPYKELNPTGKLSAQLQDIHALLGDIPHSALIPANLKQQKGRNNSKLTCTSSQCDFKSNLSNKWAQVIQARIQVQPMTDTRCPACDSGQLKVVIK